MSNISQVIIENNTKKAQLANPPTGDGGMRELNNQGKQQAAFACKGFAIVARQVE